MSRRLILAVLVAASPAAAEDVRLTPDQTMALAADLMRGGEPGKARALAEVLLERDSTDISARILAAEAAIATGDMEGGRAHAQAAWSDADVDTARFASARLNALAHAEQGHYTRSQFWLRRARQFAPTEGTSASVARDYQYIRRQNPLQFRLDFSIAPTDNLNNGTKNEIVHLVNLSGDISLGFLDANAQPLSGTEFTASGVLSWRLRETPTSLTRFELTGLSRQYRLSNEAKALAPNAEASDFAELQVSVGLTHLWRPDGSPEPWRLALTHGRFFYGGEPYSDFTRASVARGVRLGETDRLDVTVTAEHIDGLPTPVSDSIGLDLGWSRVFEDLGRIEVGLTGRDVTSESADHDYDAIGGRLGWTFEKTGIAVTYSHEERTYEDSSWVAGTRTDTRRKLGVSVPVPLVEFYGFEPVLNLDHLDQDSNAARYETTSTGAGITFRSAF